MDPNLPRIIIIIIDYLIESTGTVPNLTKNEHIINKRPKPSHYELKLFWSGTLMSIDLRISCRIFLVFKKKASQDKNLSETNKMNFVRCQGVLKIWTDLMKKKPVKINRI